MVLTFRQVGYRHPDAQALIDEVQQEYVVRYGGPDETPIETSEFDPPLGIFVVAYLDGEPVGTGAWRTTDEAPVGEGRGRNGAASAEIKRMYVRPQFRGRGYSRDILAHLEASARAHGVRWMVLETGLRQPEAISLYRSSGYVDVDSFGHYAEAELSVHLGKELPPSDEELNLVEERPHS